VPRDERQVAGVEALFGEQAQHGGSEQDSTCADNINLMCFYSSSPIILCIRICSILK
jgi:hypothetical protein